MKVTSIIQKFHWREILGNRKSAKLPKVNPLFKVCPDHSKIPLYRILGNEIFETGQVVLGFTRDGRHLLSYLTEVDVTDSQGSFCPLHQYTLQWWELHYKERAVKVHEIRLFADEEIRHELHLLVTEVADGKLVVIHGSPFMQSNSEGSNKECYVTVARNYRGEKSDTESFPSINIKYESLPPYPPFYPVVNLGIETVLLINSGEAIQALDISSLLKERQGKTYSSGLSIDDNHGRNRQPKKMLHPKAHVWHALTSNVDSSDNASVCSLSSAANTDKASQSELDNPSDNPTTSTSATEDTNESSKYRSSLKCYLKGIWASPSKLNSDDMLFSDVVCTTTQFSNCYLHRFSDWRAETSRYVDVDQLPFCGSFIKVRSLNDQTFPCVESKKLSFSTMVKCRPDSICIAQSIFDAESFILSVLNELENIYYAFFILKDYDMQMVEVCNQSNEVVILLKYLMSISHRTAENGPVKSYQQYGSSGFLLSWNVASGLVTVLGHYTLIQYNPSSIKSKRFTPSFNAAAQMRKKWFTPKGYSSDLLTFSNHTTITGKSLKYIVHPFQPMAVVL